jgi:hypothetical protein
MRETSMPRRRFASLASNGSGARPAGAFEQDRADLVILRRAARRLDQPPGHLGIERVAAIGPVHGDGEQAVLEGLQDDVVVHGVSPLRCRVIRRRPTPSLRAKRSNP